MPPTLRSRVPVLALALALCATFAPATAQAWEGHPEPGGKPDTAVPTKGDLAARFALEDYGRAAPRLAVEELPRFSAAVLHHLPYDEVAPRLTSLGLGEAGPTFWDAVRGNIDRLEDARAWWAVCTEPLQPVVTDPDLLAAAADLLPPEPLDEAAFAGWVEALKARTGKRGSTAPEGEMATAST